MEQEFKLFKHNYLFSQRKVEFLEDFATDIKKLQVKKRSKRCHKEILDPNFVAHEAFLLILRKIVFDFCSFFSQGKVLLLHLVRVNLMKNLKCKDNTYIFEVLQFSYL